MNARITAIHEGLGDASAQRSETELVIRLADGELSRLPALAASLVKDRVDAILAAGPPAVQATRGATADIPVIAIDLESDPVASGWIKNLARPANVTGVFLDFPTFSAKCLQTVRSRPVRRLPASACCGIPQPDPCSSVQLKLPHGIRHRSADFRGASVADIADAFYRLDLALIQGVLVLSSPLFGGNPLLADLAIRRHVPTIALFPDILQERVGTRVRPRHPGPISAGGSDGAQGAARFQGGRFAS